MALDFTLLTEKQIWGDTKGDGQLDVMKQYGTRVAPTDLTLILGGYMISLASGYRTSEGDLTCSPYTASSDGGGHAYCVGFDGGKDWARPYRRYVSVRPAIPPSEASKINPSEVRVLNGIRVVEYGEYPQTTVDVDTSIKLEELLESKSLRPTGRNYTFDSIEDENTPFMATSYPEYELNGKRYIRLPGIPADINSYLSTGEHVRKRKPYWVEVQPIEWLVDESGWMVSKKCLFAGIQLDSKDEYNGDFKNTSLKKYLDTYFSKEMGHEEIISRQKRDKVLTGLSARLEAATGEKAVEAIKKRLEAAERGKKTQTSPDRLDEAARMQRLMNARNILIHAAQQAYDAGDKALLDGIVDLSQHYEVLYNARKRRVASLQARRRAQRKQGDR